MKKICILDYGLGNTKSLYNSLKKINFNPVFFSENKKNNYDFVFIPGVGSFAAASKILNKKKYLDFLNKHIKNGKIFGICLGMQILHSLGEENGNSSGLGYIKGKIIKIKSTKKIILPFVGYQKVKFLHKENLLFLKKYNFEKFYFVHSYMAKLNSNENLLALTRSNDIEYPAAVIDKNIIGTQFHPEKSGEVGLVFLKDIINNF
jgi:imidazole glycerol-phosphate synthase subunit HisH